MPYIAPPPSFWRERYASVSAAEFAERQPCREYAERPLRLLLIGHNPSEHSWNSGVGYSNPSNRFWPLLREAGILPADWRAGEPVEALCNNAPGELGIGITDVLCAPGSDAQEFGRVAMRAARDGTDEVPGLFDRLAAHTRRAGAPPRLVAFVGKRQYGMLFDSPLKKVPSGVQTVLPPRWPLDPSTEVHVLTSPERPGGRATGGAPRRVPGGRRRAPRHRVALENEIKQSLISRCKLEGPLALSVDAALVDDERHALDGVAVLAQKVLVRELRLADLRARRVGGD